MKKPFLWAAAASAAGVLFRSYLIFFGTERGTGFLRRDQSWAVPLFLALLGLLFFVLNQKLRRQAAENPLADSGMLCGAPAVSTAAMLLAAAVLALSAVPALRGDFRLAGIYTVTAVPAVFGLLALIPSSWGKRARPGGESYLALLPVLWGMVGMLCTHVANNTIATVPENAFTVLGMAALLLYLYGDAKLRGLQQGGAYLSFLLLAALLLTSAVLPQTLLRLWASATGRAGWFVSHCPSIDIAMSGFVPLLWVRAATADRRLADGERECVWEPEPAQQEGAAE